MPNQNSCQLFSAKRLTQELAQRLGHVDNHPLTLCSNALLRKKQWLLALHHKHISLKEVAHQEFVVGYLTKGSQEFEGFTQFWMPITQTHSQIFVLVSIWFSGQCRYVLKNIKKGIRNRTYHLRREVVVCTWFHCLSSGRGHPGDRRSENHQHHH